MLVVVAILDACQLLQVGIEVCPYAAKEEYGLERDSREDVNMRLLPLDYPHNLTNLNIQRSVVNICGISIDPTTIPGSTLATHVVSSLVPFSTFGNLAANGLPFGMFKDRGSFQLYICNLEPDEPASMTIPKCRPANHGSFAVGGAIMRTSSFQEDIVYEVQVCIHLIAVKTYTSIFGIRPKADSPPPYTDCLVQITS